MRPARFERATLGLEVRRTKPCNPLIQKLLAPFSSLNLLIICFQYFQAFHAGSRKLLHPICTQTNPPFFLSQQLYYSVCHKVVLHNWDESFLQYNQRFMEQRWQADQNEYFRLFLHKWVPFLKTALSKRTTPKWTSRAYPLLSISQIIGVERKKSGNVDNIIWWFFVFLHWIIE